jgi:prepilin-type N-terminal cleavage/methylation domain-containing protein
MTLRRVPVYCDGCTGAELFALRRSRSGSRHASRCGARETSRFGFTLIEVLLVMAVMVVLTGLTFPAMARWKRGAEVNRAAAELRDVLLRQRVHAIREAVSVTFTPAFEGTLYELTVTDSLGGIVKSQSGTLPGTVRFVGNEQTQSIVFRADGTASDVVVRLQDAGGDRSSVVVERLTGSVRSREGDVP